MGAARLVVLAALLAAAACNYFPQVNTGGIFLCNQDSDCDEGFTCHQAADGQGYCCSPEAADPNNVCGAAGSGGADGGAGDTTPGDTGSGDTGPGDTGSGDTSTPSGWQVSSYLLPTGTRAVNAIWGRSPTDVYAGTANGVVLRFGDSGWSDWPEVRPFTNNATVRAIWGTADSIILGVSDPGAIIHWDGSNFTRHNVVAGGVYAMAGIAADDLYAAIRSSSSTAVVRFDGSNVTTLLTGSEVSCSQFNALLLLLPSGDLLVGGSQGKIIVYSSGASTVEPIERPTGESSVLGIVVNGFAEVGSDVYAVTSGHYIYRRAATQWDLVHDPGLAGALRATAGWASAGATEMIAVGYPDQLDSHAVVVFDGSSWQHLDPVQRVDLWSLWSPISGDYFLGGMVKSGTDGRILRIRAR